jgi:hypothetical protein
METIFIQIASYRDPELIPTIDDLLDNAHYPERLVICIAHQFSAEDKWDNLQKYANDSRFIIIEIPYEESLGACWARNQIQQHYNGETYTLQLDSHHRFIKGWDTECISMLKSLQSKGHSKPLLTSYIPSYNPANDPQDRHRKAWGMSFDRFTPEGVVFFMPYHMEAYVKEPVKSRFYSAHFAFTLGVFCKEVQHDPLFYFHGEEITIGVRAFTWGYDLFHPHKVLAWHEYTRQGRTKHWDDDKNWGMKNERAHHRTKQLLGVDGEVCSPCNAKSFEGYNVGTVRTIKDYEQYSGIRFIDRAITEACSKNIEPPGSADAIYHPKFKHSIDLTKNHFTESDIEFAALIFENHKNEEMYRKDIDKNELQSFMSGANDNFTVWREFNGTKPNHWVLWPYSASKGWLERTVVNI